MKYGAMLATLALLAGLATAQEEWVPLAAIEHGDESWSWSLVPADGPPRDGEPTVALRWPVAERPGPDSPALVRGFDKVAALRFWLHLDQPREYRLNVLLTGGSNGYFMTAIPLDWSGWRQITIPIEQFGKVREIALDEVSKLSFRMQGYGQPELPDDMVWWVDQLEAKAMPGETLPRTDALADTRAEWEALAAEGNPLWLLLEQAYEKPVGEFTPPETVTSAWTWRTVASNLLPIAWAAGAAESPHRSRADLVAHAVAGIDYLVSRLDDEGWWWKGRPLEGDPNTNRFVLGPTLDAVRYLRMIPEGEAAWPRWRDKLDAAVDLQRRAYQGELDWDWGGLAGGEYVNQDAYYVLIMALSAELFERPADQALAEAMMRRIADNLLPDGGLRYIGAENEAPVYHALNLIVLGRYATLTDDPVARQLLADTADYHPLVMSAEGQPEYWSDVWWKQTWGMPMPYSHVVAAGATGDARNQYLLWRVLERTPPRNPGMDGLYAAPYWTGTDPGAALDSEYLVPDANARGLRGRSGDWYFGVAIGRGLRNTFAGGMVTNPQHSRPLKAALRTAQIDVLLPNKRENGLWLSQIDDRAALAQRPGETAALGVQYRPQPATINGWPTPETPDTPWQVTQVWSAAGDGLLGRVVLEALEDGAPGIGVAGRIALGPAPPRPDGDTWLSGPLRVKLLETFAAPQAAKIPGYARDTERDWGGLVMHQPIEGAARAGDRYVYAVWAGPEDVVPPESLDALPDDLGWVAVWPDGRRRAVLFNPGGEPLEASVPWGEAAAAAWTGETGHALTVRPGDAVVRVTVPAGATVVVE